jgi:hypothetical protein
MFLTARQLCEGALRMTGAYAVNDTAARPQDMAVALELLDDLIGELSGVIECFWLLTSTVSLPLTAGTLSYDLATALGSSYPSQGIEYVRDAWIESSTGDRGEIELCTRHKIETQSPQDQSGKPTLIHVDRLAPLQTLRPWPVPADTSWTLKLVIQALSPTVRGVGPVPKTDAGQSISSSLPSSWNRWAKFALAADCGSGPVRKLPTNETNNWRGIAQVAKGELLTFQNREHETTPPVTASMDVLMDPTSIGPGHREEIW